MRDAPSAWKRAQYRPGGRLEATKGGCRRQAFSLLKDPAWKTVDEISPLDMQSCAPSSALQSTKANHRSAPPAGASSSAS